MNIVEVTMPKVKINLKKRKMKKQLEEKNKISDNVSDNKKVNSSSILSSIEDDDTLKYSALNDYNLNEYPGSMGEYLEMIIQYG